MSENIIFEYRKNAVYGNLLSKKPTGFKIQIMDNENIKYYELSMNNDIIKSEEYPISIKTINRIKDLINDNQEIFEVNSKLYNGSFDGACNEFIFAIENKIKIITALNIEVSIGREDDKRNSEKKTMDDAIEKLRQERRRRYLEKYGENLKQERLVLNLFFKICEVLKQEDYELNLYYFRKIGN